ncbi:MAG: aminoglycoside 3'-phosphotransferase [Sphingomonas sp.]|nr:aminoglycoside 3'-phosphotransferase [Sphingomonas sp.]
MVAAQSLPLALGALVDGYAWHPVEIGESGGTVHRLAAPDRPSLFLKQGTGRVATDIVDEFARLAWLQSRCSVPGIVHFTAADDAAWLLTTALPGKAAYAWLCDHPGKRAAAIAGMAQFLRHLHALPPEHCPFNATLPFRLAAARANIDAGRIDLDDFQPEHQGWSAEQLWAKIQDMLPIPHDPVVTHGDFSLDNIFLDDDGNVLGCIDVGRVGLADRYQDLAILSACLDEFDPDLKTLLFAGYGVRPDLDRIALHLALDELF